MAPLQNTALLKGVQGEEKAPIAPIGYNCIDARGWLIMSPVPPSDVAQQEEDGTTEEGWYILTALLASSATAPASATAVQTLIQQQCPRWRGLAKVWVAQKSLHVDYVDAVKQELLLPTAFYTCFPASK